MNIHYSVTDQDSFYSRSCSTLNRRKCKYRLRWMRYVWKNVIYNILCFTQRCPEHHRVKMRPAPDSAESSWVVSWTWVKLNKRTAPGYWVSEVTAFIYCTVNYDSYFTHTVNVQSLKTWLSAVQNSLIFQYICPSEWWFNWISFKKSIIRGDSCG